MPLVRYEIRNEYSLANPDLYRAAAKDDPEGLLEGVAMAGLVGIVRQLGDLAEFAAEVFHDLHEEILATAARGHELMIRVQQLESEIPLIEKTMLTESKIDHENFIYNQGVVWHAVIRNDQNHFTQGDLPHFIRNAYEECRGPPRLFMLDKFDVAGAGACLKRYTDPFFFKMEWASTELMKAEKEQQDKRARRIKKKKQAVDSASRTSENGALRQTENGLRILRGSFTNPVVEKQIADAKSVEPDYASVKPSEFFLNGDASLRISGDAAMQTKGVETFGRSEAAVIVTEETASEGSSLRMLKDTAVGMSGDTLLEDSRDIGYALENSESTTLMMSENASSGTSDDAVLRATEIEDFASETENFVDALTTMDSEVETDTEMKLNNEDEERNDFVASKHICSDSSATMDSKNVLAEDKPLYYDNKYEEPEAIMSHSSQFHIEKDATALSHGKSKRVLPHADSITENDERSVHIPDMSEQMFQQTCELNAAGNKETMCAGYATNEEQDQIKETHVTDIGFISSFIGDDKIPSSINGSVTSNMSERNDRMSRSGYQWESESLDDRINSHELAGIVGIRNAETNGHSTLPALAHLTPPFKVSGTDDCGNFEMENLSASSLGDETRDMIFGRHRSLSPDIQMQSTKEVFKNGSLTSDMEKYNLRDSDNDLSDSSLKETSPHSSADSSIKPIKWSTKSHGSASDSDDEMDAMQVSSASSSTLSSPRPSTLATVLNVELERSKFMHSSERSVEASPVSHLTHSPKSVASTTSATSQRAIVPDQDISTDNFLMTPHAEVLRSLNSEQLKLTVAEPCASHPEPTISIPAAFHDSFRGEPLRSSSEVFKFPSFEPLKSSPEPLISLSVGSTLPNVSTFSQSNYTLSTMSSLEFPDNNARSVFDDPEKFPPPPPLPPLQWRTSKKFQSTASKDKESSSISVHESTLMIPDIEPKSFDHLGKDLPASQVSWSHETPIEVSEFPDAATIADSSSQSAATDHLDNTKLHSLSEAFEPSITGAMQTFHDTSSTFADGSSDAKNIISPETIKPTISPTSSRNVSDRYDMDSDPVDRFSIENHQGDGLVMKSLDEFKLLEVSPGLLTQANMIKPKELSVSLDNSLDNMVHSQASSTSHQESLKLPIKAEGSVQSFEQKPVDLYDWASFKNGKKVNTEVGTTVLSCPDIQENWTLFEVENTVGGSSISDILERSLVPQSIVTDKDANDTVSLGSKVEKIPVTTLEGSQTVEGDLHASQAVTSDLPPVDIVKPDRGVNFIPVLPLQRNDSLIEAIASHDKNTLKKVPEWSQSSRSASPDERGVLLEQIRNRSFSLRQIKVEKQAGPRQATNINVAAILEKANAIRQAFAGSDDDEDDDWSDG